MVRVKVDVSIPDRGKFQAALAEARRQGLDISRAFEDLGLASGIIDSTALDALLQIDGIASIVPDRAVPLVGGTTATILRFTPKKR